MKTLIVQKWEESERGWGTRPDGYTLHMKREDVGAFLRAMREREKKSYGGCVPDEYSMPCGEPYEWDCSNDVLVAEIEKSENGIWGQGRNPPKPKPGVNPGGWMPVER